MAWTTSEASRKAANIIGPSAYVDWETLLTIPQNLSGQVPFLVVVGLCSTLLSAAPLRVGL